MSTDKPSIAELQRSESAMTALPWTPHVWYGSDHGGHAAVGPHHVACDDHACDHAPESSCSDMERAQTDADGIAALRNAAPVLLEIAAAALAAHGACDHPAGRCGNGSPFRGCSRFAGEAALNAAIRKVRP